MKVGDKVVGKIVGIKNIGYDNLIFIMIGNTLVTLFEKDNPIEIVEQEQYKNNEINITKDGYIQCPYTTSGVECSVYLKGSCKDCTMSIEE